MKNISFNIFAGIPAMYITWFPGHIFHAVKLNKKLPDLITDFVGKDHPYTAIIGNIKFQAFMNIL